MARTWGVSFGETERTELERIMIDEDPASALEFLRTVIYPRVKESEKPGGCYHDPSKPVGKPGRPVKRHKELGSS